jgi:hypothetical protein
MPVAALLFAAALGDTPLWLELAELPWRGLTAAAEARRQLTLVPNESALLAQPNLIPHLPRRFGLIALGREVRGPEPQVVVLCEVGNLWPLDRSEIRRRIEEYRADARFEELGSGPAFVFQRKDGSSSR